MQRNLSVGLPISFVFLSEIHRFAYLSLIYFVVLAKRLQKPRSSLQQLQEAKACTEMTESESRKPRRQHGIGIHGIGIHGIHGIKAASALRLQVLSHLFLESSLEIHLVTSPNLGVHKRHKSSSSTICTAPYQSK